jgi:hypothetical protein
MSVEMSVEIILLGVATATAVMSLLWVAMRGQ